MNGITPPPSPFPTLNNNNNNSQFYRILLQRHLNSHRERAYVYSTWKFSKRELAHCLIILQGSPRSQPRCTELLKSFLVPSYKIRTIISYKFGDVCTSIYESNWKWICPPTTNNHNTGRLDKVYIFRYWTKSKIRL